MGCCQIVRTTPITSNRLFNDRNRADFITTTSDKTKGNNSNSSSYRMHKSLFVGFFECEATEKYQNLVKIGSGGFGTVYQAYEICSGIPRALKFIPLSKTDKSLILEEIENLKQLVNLN